MTACSAKRREPTRFAPARWRSGVRWRAPLSGRCSDAAGGSTLTIFDVDLRQHFWSQELIVESLQSANVLKLNDEELPTLARLLGLAGDESSLLKQLAARFALTAVALTKGAEGSLLLADGELVNCPGSRIAVADTVGAGDSYTAALALGLLAGHEPSGSSSLPIWFRITCAPTPALHHPCTVETTVRRKKGGEVGIP